MLWLPSTVLAMSRTVLASATAATDTYVVSAVLTGLALGVLFGLPWIAAVVWVSWRVGWRVLWSDNGKEFQTQAKTLRGFGAR